MVMNPEDRPKTDDGEIAGLVRNKNPLDFQDASFRLEQLRAQAEQLNDRFDCELEQLLSSRLQATLTS